MEKVPKEKRSRRVIDIDPGTLAVLRALEKERGTLALPLARDDALVFGDQEGRHPERFWRAFKSAQRQCAKALGDGAHARDRHPRPAAHARQPAARARNCIRCNIPWKA